MSEELKPCPFCGCHNSYSVNKANSLCELIDAQPTAPIRRSFTGMEKKLR